MFGEVYETFLIKPPYMLVYINTTPYMFVYTNVPIPVFHLDFLIPVHILTK